MLDINALERRWLKYKIKTYLPYGAGLAVLLGAAAVSAWWLGTPPASPSKQPIPETNTSRPQPTAASTPAAPTDSVDPMRLEPSMDFVHSFQTAPAAEPATQPLQHPAPPKAVPQSQIPASKALSMPEPPPPPAAVSPSDKDDPKGLAINRNETKLDINELQTRFKETSNANLGLFIARYYYDHGNYSEAYNYALKTNTLNNRLDESWLIFAKSLVKMGKNDQAKRTLQVYISQSGSDSAKELLGAIEKGSFK